jgi:hypothetical protein
MKEKTMKRFTANKNEVAEKNFRGIYTLLFTQGFGRTLDYFCTFSVFSVLSAD